VQAFVGSGAGRSRGRATRVGGILAAVALAAGLFGATPTRVQAETGGATHLQVFVSGSEQATCVAGMPFVFTVIARMIDSAYADWFSDGVHFTSSDPQAILPADYTFQPGQFFGDGGVHEFWATLRTAGRQTITVTDVSHSEITGSLAIDCSPGPAIGLVMSLPAATTAGAVASLTVRALDAWGNAAAGYRGTIHFMSSDAQAVLPADYTFTAADRGGQAFIVTLKTAGSRSITAIDLAQPALTVTGSTTVTAAPYLVIDLGPTRSAGASGYSYDVWAVDASGDPATGYVGTIHFTSSDPQADLPPDYAFTTADHGHAVVEGLTLKTAGNQWVRAVDVGNNLIQGTSPTLVTPGPTRSVRFSGLPSSIGAGMGASVWVTPLDGFGNIKTDYVGGDVHFASTDPQAVLPATYQFVAGDYGSHGFTVTLRTAGSQSLTVYAGSYSAMASTTVVPGDAAHLAVSGLATPRTAGAVGTVTVRAVDAQANTTAGYRGTVHFTSSDPAAVLPADYAFVSGDAGAHTFSVTLKTAGTQSITATDTVPPSITGSQTGIVVVAATGFLRVTSSPALPTQISIGGVIADSWGLNWVELSPGSHTVSFSHVEGYTEPAPVTVTVTAGTTTTVTGSFTQRGSLHVVTSPAVAGTISVDGTPRDAWGMWTDLPTGPHQVCFGPVVGYTPPACVNTTLTAGMTNTVTAAY
jgi:hypothetical protein